MNLRHQRLKKLYLVQNKQMKTASEKLIDICQLYLKVKSVLKFISVLLFWKPKWKASLKLLMDELDAICPSEN